MAGTRRMNVIDAQEVKNGTDSKGRGWTLYEITAVTPDGAPIDEKLKSFTRLSGDVEVEVERQEHEKYGVSYLLKPVSSPGARLGPKVDDLHGTVEQLGRTVADACNELARLVARVADLERHAGIQPAAAPPAPPAAPGERATF
jgi:hypothetical protein